MNLKPGCLPSLFIFLLLMPLGSGLYAQNNQLWHDKEREIHYRPDGEDFVLEKGSRRFNRALYGGNSGFRAEAGDLPEFALYLPGMGGNLKFGLIAGDSSKWIIDAGKIETRYRPGSMIYEIKDPLLENGSLTITAMATFDKEGLIIKMESMNIPPGVKLFAAYGGATGTRFSREGDIGADPESSFYLKPEYCKGNVYNINKNAFTLYYGAKSLTEEERYEIQYKPAIDPSKLSSTLKTISGIFPSGSLLKIRDAHKQVNPLQFFSAIDSTTPAIVTQIDFIKEPVYFFIQNGKAASPISYNELPAIFAKAETTRKELAGRIKLNTPDPFINTLGGALALASDAVWENPSFLHGAVAWRMRLPGWRGAYLADVLGWHDRAKTHFSSYALSQVTSPSSGPVEMDTALHLARHAEKMGTSVFSSGYISRNPGGDKRPHHYDMNLVFIDQLLNHFLWTGDTAYVRQMWPLLKRHLDWENRNFDVDGDNLYDAYAAIWASDALQYSGGGVTHSSAYNYRAFKMAGDLAVFVGEDPEPYRKKAAAILKAINTKLWMPSKGVYAEYKDLLGKQLLHPSPALWTIYHAIDSHVPDPFQAYQSLQYINDNIPHIPILAKGLKDSSLYTISTTTWQPYTWSLNNVVLGEVMHTALAYWQGGRSEEAYKLWKGSLIESMYLGASPGNFQQLSFYDAVRGELYRDFADDIGMAARSLVEGLFGIFMDALHDTLYVRPGFPANWDHASVSTPDIDYKFTRKGNVDNYQFKINFKRRLNLCLQIKARLDDVESIMVNGETAKWTYVATAIETPVLKIIAPSASDFRMEIKWKGKKIERPELRQQFRSMEQVVHFKTKAAELLEVYDPQNAIKNLVHGKRKFNAVANTSEGNKTFFVRLKQGKASYWMPFSFVASDPVGFMFMGIVDVPEENSVNIINYTNSVLRGKLFLNHVYESTVSTTGSGTPIGPKLVSGTNRVHFERDKNSYAETYTDWDVINLPSTKYEKIDLSPYFNDQVNNIFKQQYLSPRPTGPTLQLPTQGIGNWAYPLVLPNISDSGLRARAGYRNEFTIAQGIPFATPSLAGVKNILFTSQWDNYPDSAIVPLNGKASHAYFLMTGSTNPMQSRMVNGELVVQYKDGSEEKLELKNPENWWPIEQDYYEDGFAFTTDAPKPVRVYFKTGEDTRTFKNFSSIRGFSNRAIDGGAGTVLDLPLHPDKELKALVLRSVANDVVIGLMSLTLVR